MMSAHGPRNASCGATAPRCGGSGPPRGSRTGPRPGVGTAGPPFVIYHAAPVGDDPFEIEICRIDGAWQIPLGILPLRYAEVPQDREVVVHCRSGARSAQAVQFLQSRGYTDVKNLVGGILRWIDEIDPSQPKY